MAVNGVFPESAGRTGAWNLYTERRKSECEEAFPTSSHGVPGTGASFQPRPCATRVPLPDCVVRVCVHEHRKLLEVSIGGR